MERLGYLFYIVNPNETLFSRPDEVPELITQAIPFFVALIVIEQAFAFWKGLPQLHVGDAITSAGQGILMEQTKIIFPAFNIVFYSYIYENYRIVDLPCDSLWMWFLSLLLIDFGFYWFHRACHEVNFLWATHQVHHSSEHFNLTTALRQSVPQLYFHTIFYLPLALFLPPSLYLVHFEFNTLFQFWIHTGVVSRLGPLEYIINTPSHHRVHHGRNRYCIDKNYASVFILWDRLFGTFAPEGEKIHFGLTHPIRSFDPTHLQLSHYRALVKRLKETSGLKNKVSVIIKGPGWDTGKPRLGLITDIPDVKGDSVVEIFNPSIPCHMQLYCALHFFVMLYFHVQMTERSTHLSHTTTLIIFSFIFTSLTSLGAMMEGQSYSERLELFRCWFFVFIEHILLPTSHYRSSVFMTIVRHGIKLVYFVSLLILMIRQLTRVGLLQKLTKDIRIRIK